MKRGGAQRRGVLDRHVKIASTVSARREGALHARQGLGQLQELPGRRGDEPGDGEGDEVGVTAVVQMEEFPGPLARAIAARLIPAEGRPVRSDTLIDELWGERAASNPVNALLGEGNYPEAEE